MSVCVDVFASMCVFNVCFDVCVSVCVSVFV